MALPVVRRAVPADVSAILRIEDESFAGPNWLAGAFASYATTVAEVEGKVAGVIVIRETFVGAPGELREIEILNLAVAPEFRRRGVASALLQWLLRSPGEYFLEVRESNYAAQELYRKFNFVHVGGRVDYYQNPVESALVMKMKRC